MAVHGSGSKLFIDGVRAGVHLRDLNFNGTQEVAEVSGFEHPEMHYKSGQQSGTFGCGGVNPNDDSLPQGTENDRVVASYAFNPALDAGRTTALGQARVPSRCLSVLCRTTTVTKTNTINDAVMWSFDSQLDSDDWMVLLGRLMVDRTYTNDATADTRGRMDLGAAVSTGILFVCHTAGVRDDPLTAVMIQHSTAPNGTWSDLVTFTANRAVGSVGAEPQAVASGTTVQRYIRASVQGSSAAATADLVIVAHSL